MQPNAIQLLAELSVRNTQVKKAAGPASLLKSIGKFLPSAGKAVAHEAPTISRILPKAAPTVAKSLGQTATNLRPPTALGSAEAISGRLGGAAGRGVPAAPTVAGKHLDDVEAIVERLGGTRGSPARSGLNGPFPQGPSTQMPSMGKSGPISAAGANTANLPTARGGAGGLGAAAAGGAPTVTPKVPTARPPTVPPVATGGAGGAAGAGGGAVPAAAGKGRVSTLLKGLGVGGLLGGAAAGTYGLWPSGAKVDPLDALAAKYQKANEALQSGSFLPGGFTGDVAPHYAKQQAVVNDLKNQLLAKHKEYQDYYSEAGSQGRLKELKDRQAAGRYTIGPEGHKDFQTAAQDTKDRIALLEDRIKNKRYGDAIPDAERVTALLKKHNIDIPKVKPVTSRESSTPALREHSTFPDNAMPGGGGGGVSSQALMPGYPPYPNLTWSDRDVPQPLWQWQHGAGVPVPPGMRDRTFSEYHFPIYGQPQVSAPPPPRPPAGTVRQAPSNPGPAAPPVQFNNWSAGNEAGGVPAPQRRSSPAEILGNAAGQMPHVDDEQPFQPPFQLPLPYGP